MKLETSFTALADAERARLCRSETDFTVNWNTFEVSVPFTFTVVIILQFQ